MVDGVAQLGALIPVPVAALGSYVPAALGVVQHLSVALALHLPLALDGEAATEAGGNGKAIAIVSAVSIAFGYLVLAALWHFVFREKARTKRKKSSSE
jgi:putative effector of murein hydrolase LrgA (UPF0299 family)